MRCVTVFVWGLLCATVAARFDLSIGLHLTKDEDLEEADVYDGTNTNPVNPNFSLEQCNCTVDSCLNCFLEHHQADSRHFYVQNSGKKAIRYRDPPIVEVFPLRDTDPTVISLAAKTYGETRQYTLKPDGKVTTLEIDFECVLLKSTSAAQGLFLVAINLEVSNSDTGKYENVTWYLRKACLTSVGPATGLNVMYRTNKVVDGGVTQPSWRVSTKSVRDVGYDAKDKDVNFQIYYTGGDLPISFQLADDIEFDESVIKSVSYKSDSLNTKGTITLTSGAPPVSLNVRVTCQPHPIKEAKPGEVTIGLANVMRNKQSLRDVMWKFQIECPYHGHKITPLGVLGIVLFVYLFVACAGGYAYNIHYTNRRGLFAIPLVPALRDVIRDARIRSKQRQQNRYRPVATHDHDDHDHDNPTVDEEYLPTVVSSREPAYGAI